MVCKAKYRELGLALSVVGSKKDNSYRKNESFLNSAVVASNEGNSRGTCVALGCAVGVGSRAISHALA
jgi:hypothetical protein